MFNDRVIPIAAAQFHRHLAAGQIPVIITARPATHKGATVKWILEHVFGTPQAKLFMLLTFMREAHHEGMPSVDLKKQLMSDFMTAYDVKESEISCAYDDRHDVIEMYRSKFGIRAMVLDHNGIIQPCKKKAQEQKIEDSRLHSMEDVEKAVQEVAANIKALDATLNNDEYPVQPQPYAGGSGVDGNARIGGAGGGLGVASVGSAKASDDKSYIGHLAATMLNEAAQTLRERSNVYKDNSKVAGAILAAMYPNGITLKTADEQEMFTIISLIAVKLSRFAESGNIHRDSVVDLVNYSAILCCLRDRIYGLPTQG
jgi:hypothetical protein